MARKQLQEKISWCTRIERKIKQWTKN